MDFYNKIKINIVQSNYNHKLFSKTPLAQNLRK